MNINYHPEELTRVSTDSNLPVIEISDLYKAFGDNKVLNGFNLKVHKGESIVVLGRSGSGKSVLIKCIVGLLPYDKGSIKVEGKEVNQLNQHELDSMRRKIGFLFQSNALYDSLTVRENLLFPLRRHRKAMEPATLEQLVIENLKSVGLLNALHKMPSELSGGMRKRIGIARCLMQQPEYMLYDEPTTGLDPETGKEISKLMIMMHDKFKSSSITITHDMKCARMVADRLAVLHDGICYASGTYETLEQMNDPKTKAFFE